MKIAEVAPDRALDVRDELVAALRECQSVLAALTESNKRPDTTVIVAWANCVAAESRARAALAKVPT